MQKNASEATGQATGRSLTDWLAYLESIHPATIDMGLERVRAVFNALQLDFSNTQIVTVAGTNGKGTTCALIEQGCKVADKSVAVYSSPHLVDYRERVRVNGQMLSEPQHCDAFARVEQARGDISLTYFEFGTLAGMVLIADACPDIALMEVGLGGRLDAVNVLNPDLAVITGIDLDHQAWLGDTREAIAVEKAGIFRADIPAVIGDPEPPQSLVRCADTAGVRAYWQGRDFGYQQRDGHWSWHNASASFGQLPVPAIPQQNAATACQVLMLLGLNLSEAQLAKAIQAARLRGRLERIGEAPDVYLDVAHNPQATRYLRDFIAQQSYQRLHLVVAMLADKDIDASLLPLKSLNAHWYPASLDHPRGANVETIKQVLVGQEFVLPSNAVGEAYRKALDHAGRHDLVIVFGSFFTVAHILNSTE